ncbi:MAG: hypothetical protein AB7U25_11915 [Vicinamibacterales bacterium]
MADPTLNEGDPGLLSIEACRELLGDEALRLSDEDVDRVRRHAANLAYALIEIALESSSQEQPTCPP